ncbi:MAG: rhomboid family intramembrane serine protease [Actinomycetota bacterium]|nr:rhomboid family intramembrane serine protease [Actinomycetota bacterium]MDH4352397.1 rhomboid family intramembrane serine protease [Actinomycetota bacterium]MDH5277829.1 rhomboid family intramembrane serine protease [Actinomycetota bacterium]
MTEPSPSDGADPAAVPYCFRHPDRESWIRCTRCDRPICPDCRTDAPVGFHCPECIQQSGRTVREGRTVAGGRIRRDPVRVTKILIAVNVALYVMQYVSDGRVTQDFAMQGFAVADAGEYYRLVTAAFLHASLTHLGLNMLALWLVGGAVEARLGRSRYLTVYLVSALAGSVLSYAVDPAAQVSVGASGAVFGLFGAFAVMAFRLRIDVGGIIGIIAINVVIGFVPAFNINWRAHLGGLLAGAVLTMVMVFTPQRARVWATVVAAALIVALCVGVTMWRTDHIQSCLNAEIPVEQCDVLF